MTRYLLQHSEVDSLDNCTDTHSLAWKDASGEEASDGCNVNDKPQGGWSF